MKTKLLAVTGVLFVATVAAVTIAMCRTFRTRCEKQGQAQQLQGEGKDMLDDAQEDVRERM
jgi:hypothetical protein